VGTISSLKKKESQLQRELENKIESMRLEDIETLAKKKAAKLGLPYLNLRVSPIDQSAVQILPEAESQIGRMAVIAKSGKNLKVAVADPELIETKKTLEELRRRGFTPGLVVVSGLSLESAWKRYLLKKEDQTNLGIVELKESELNELQSKIKDIADLKERMAKIAVSKILGVLIAGAIKVGASDIHLEPEERGIRLRYRLDGLLYDVVFFPPVGYQGLLSRIKLTSGLKINVHDIPQDGRFTIRQESQDIEVRVSVLPGAYGENVVMRILDPRAMKQKLGDLGVRDDVLKKIQSLLRKSAGAILTTGPTGSGKTTTLYTFIKHINSPDSKIITIEDPIEYHISGISQTQVDPQSGYSFASGLKSIVRQDPDVILVGEIRDSETAEIAMQAALTGHLVFSTLHTNDAAGAIPRLINFGISPVTIAPAINAVMAQRLVRNLCPDCKKKQRIKSEDLGLIKKYLSAIGPEYKLPPIGESLEIFYPQKCERCNLTGYRGRLGVYEIFEVDREIESLILKSPAISEIREAAIKKGMITLIQDGLLKVLEGRTSVEEVLRVVGE
jgi:type II secretory ATPase GspE/PulE/Tfp pilus assembly ATPase PilB-like protein